MIRNLALMLLAVSTCEPSDDKTKPYAQKAHKHPRHVVRRTQVNAPVRKTFKWPPGTGSLDRHILKQLQTGFVRVVPPASIPALRIAEQRLSRTCPAVIARSTARVRTLRDLTYWEFDIVAADETPAGRLRVLFAVASPDYGVVSMFPPLLRPARSKTMAAAGVIERSILAEFEKVQGLQPGKVTPLLLQAIILIHEYLHVLRLLPPDRTLEQSMSNSEYVIKHCFPELKAPVTPAT